jgi:hypothetical protein
MTKYINILIAVILMGCNAERVINCSSTCIGDGISTTATVCGDTLMENHNCQEPEFGEPIEGEEVIIIRGDGGEKEKATILFLDEKDDGFWISGQLNNWDLGAGVWMGEALIGIVEDGEGHERFARNIGR